MAADWDVQLLELARYRLESFSLTDRIQLQWVEPTRLIFQDEYFDTAFSLHRCHEWQDPLMMIREMHRVVRKGGLVCVRDWIRPNTAEQLEEALLELGPEETTELESSARDLHRHSLLAS